MDILAKEFDALSAHPRKGILLALEPCLVHFPPTLDFGHPLSSLWIPLHSAIRTEGSVIAIERSIDKSEIAPSVISLVAIYMVHLTIRPFAGDVKPREAMSSGATAGKSYRVVSSMKKIGSITDLVAMSDPYLSGEFSGFGIVMHKAKNLGVVKRGIKCFSHIGLQLGVNRVAAGVPVCNHK